MVPPWVADLESPVANGTTPDAAAQQDVSVDTATQDSGSQDGTVVDQAPQEPIPIAPAGRFGNARRSLGDFARSGDTGSMRRAVGRYIQGGYGGGKTATRRFSGTARTADALYSALGGMGAGGAGSGTAASPAVNSLDPVLLTGRSVDDVMDAVVEAVRPVDGTQDTEASRAAIKDALAEMLTRFPDADLLTLEADQREFAIERYVAADVFRRFDLDLGRTIRDKAPTAVAALGRLKEVRDYIKETVAAAFRTLRNAGQRMAAGRIAQIVKDALRETFKVFEEYAE